jgi:hypothetical protein
MILTTTREVAVVPAGLVQVNAPGVVKVWMSGGRAAPPGGLMMLILGIV